MKWLVGLIAACSLCLSVGAQSLVLNKTINLPEGVDDVDIDQFGNLYLIIDSEIRKLSNEGSFIASFADPSFGEINQIDVLNALNPLIYYSDFNQLRILDNRLNESQTLSMLNLGFNDPKFIAYSDQNRIWVYDQSADRLLQYSLETQQIVNRSPIISQLGLPEPEVAALNSGFNYSIIYIQNQGFISFDALGAKKEIIFEKDSLRSFDFDNRRWLSLSNKGLLKLYPIHSSKKVQSFIAPHPKADKILLRNLNVYFWEGNKLYQYHLE